MKKRVLSLFLALAMIAVTLPLQALAAGDVNSVKLLGKSGDRLTGYYVRYEINGIEYRSDQADTAMNKMAWQGMSDSDRRETLYVYAFAPDVRREQFGNDGAQQMADWINEKQGWTALWAEYAKRIEEQQCGPLVEFFSDENYAAVVEELQQNAKGDYDSWYNRMTWYSEYPEARAVIDRYNAIGVLMSSGKAAYNCIVKAYTKAREASVKAISKELISIIVDKALTPNITVAPTAATTSVYTGLIDLLFAVTGTSDQITQKIVGQAQGGMEAVEVIYAMREIAMRNYNLANYCYRHAKELSDSIDSEAKAAYEICKSKSESNALKAEQEAEDQRRAEEAQALHEAEYAEALASLYESMTSGAPQWNPPKNSTDAELDYYYGQYRSSVQSFISNKKTAFASSYNSLAGDYDSWYKKYVNAAQNLIDDYDLYRMRNIEMELYPNWQAEGRNLSGLTFNWPYCRDYQPTEPGWVYYAYVEFDDDRLADYRRAVDEYKADLRNAKTDAQQFMNKAVGLYEDAIAEYHDLVARQNALTQSNWVQYVTDFNRKGEATSWGSDYLYEGEWDAFWSRWEDETDERDNSEKLLKHLKQLADMIGESTVASVDLTIERIDDMTAEMLRMRRERLEYIRGRIDEYNSVKSNYDLAASWGAQQRDKRDALLAGLPDYLHELKGSLVNSWSNELGTFYSVSPYPHYTEVTKASPKLVELLAAASDPLQKARSEGAMLSAKLDEYNTLTARMKNAVSAMDYYIADLGSIASEIGKYTNGSYGLPALAEYDYWADRDYILSRITYEQAHDCAALQVLTCDLNGWGEDFGKIAFKLAELKTQKSSLIRQLQQAEDYKRSGIINDLRTSVQRLYAYFTRDSFYGDARHTGFMADKKMTGDLYGECTAFIDWLEEHYAKYVLPNGIGKGGVVLLDDEPDMILAGAGDRGQLKAVVTPDNATDKGVVWESLSPEVIEVDENGVVLAVAEGEGEVRARALDAPAEAVYEGDTIVGYTYGDEYYVTFTVRVDPSAFKAAEAEGSEAFAWRNFGSDSAPRFTKVTELDGVTTVSAAFKAEPDDSVLCLALFDAEGRMLAVSTVPNSGIDSVVTASTDKTPASARLFLMNGDMTPAAVPPIDETLN